MRSFLPNYTLLAAVLNYFVKITIDFPFSCTIYSYTRDDFQLIFTRKIQFSDPQLHIHFTKKKAPRKWRIFMRKMPRVGENEIDREELRHAK